MIESILKDVREKLFEAEETAKDDVALASLYAATKTAALNQTTLGYDEAGKITGIFSGTERFSNLLFTMVQECAKMDLPLFPCCVKSKSKTACSEGFFNAVEYFIERNPKAFPEYKRLSRQEFWDLQFKRCCDYMKKS